MILLLLTAATLGTLIGVALTFGPHGAVGIAVCAAGVIAWYLVRALRRDKQRARDKARRRPIIRYWTADWREIIPPTKPTIIIRPDPPQDRSGMGCGRCGRSQFFSHTCIDGEMVRGAYDGLVG